jgi:hypothetical protein
MSYMWGAGWGGLLALLLVVFLSLGIACMVKHQLAGRK